MITIPEFYSGRDVFISGGSGFMGKVLIEKLLRSCPTINRVFLLLRSKKGKSVSERIEQIKNTPLFASIKKENPSAFDKIVGVPGDVQLINLGFNEKTYKLLENVSVIFHSAASVRFDDQLTDALLLNTRGTHEICKFALKLKYLISFVHVSTTYCNPDHAYVEEKLYPPHGDWRQIIKIAESVDRETLNWLMPKFTNFAPNTYTYSKGLAEQVCDSFKDRLPLVIFRPSIVVGAEREPLPGWTDNMNGPVGLLVACGVGIMRTMYASPDAILDCIAVDTVIKALIVSAWICGVGNQESFTPAISNAPIKVYNVSSLHSFRLGYLVGDGQRLLKEMPFKKGLWPAGGGVTTNKLRNYTRIIFLQLLPAFIIDQIFKLIGRQPFLLKLQRRIENATQALRVFIFTEWEIVNENFLEMNKMILPMDKEAFDYSRRVHDTDDLYRIQIIGARRYVLKEGDESIPSNQIKYKRMLVVDSILKSLFVCGLLYFIYCTFNIGQLLLSFWNVNDSTRTHKI